ncbi:GspH/FimT family pseudopilin [Vibrio rumoiensis]|uniref:Type II secretion system protein H n=1 Tax=Vibrio rumoiensis TaxID=76258 RepID=A0ABW7J1L0_9VIBR
MKKNGFTLIELLIAIVIIVILLGAGVPSFSEYYQKLKMTRLAGDIQSFMSMARSESVLRNKKIYLHLIGLDTTGVKNNWCLLLSVNNAATDCDDDPIYLVRGSDYKNITVKQELSSNVLEFGGINGRPSLSSIGTNGYGDIVSFHQKTEKALMAKVHIFGRSKVCGVGGEWYGSVICL